MADRDCLKRYRFARLARDSNDRKLRIRIIWLEMQEKGMLVRKRDEGQKKAGFAGDVAIQRDI
jgi:hypothetical protein